MTQDKTAPGITGRLAARVKAAAAALRTRARPVSAAVRGDKSFSFFTLAVVAAVAGIAFAVSYQHQYELSIYYRQTHWVAGMNPFTVDLLIVAAGLVIWYAARHGHPRPKRAYAALAAGVAATVIANLAADHHYAWPWLGPGISVWPAIAFVGAYEMAMWMVRMRAEATKAPGGHTGPAAGTVPLPAPVRREPRRAVAPREPTPGRGRAAVTRTRQPKDEAREQAVLERILSQVRQGRQPPTTAGLGRSEWGTARSPAAKRVMDQVRALTGQPPGPAEHHGPDEHSPIEHAYDPALARASMNGGGHD